MNKFFIWLYKAIKDLTLLCTIGTIIIGGFSYYEVLNGIRVEIQQATSTANENMTLTLDAFCLSLKKMNDELLILKELAGIKRLEEYQSRLEYAQKTLDIIQATDAKIGTDGLIGSEIDNPIAAKKWAASARGEARLIAFKSRDENEIIWTLSTTITKQDWLIQFGESDPISMYEWLSSNNQLTNNSLTN